MPRPGVSYNEVAAVADAFLAAGIYPTQKKVREKLESGSIGTIHRWLKQWKEVNPQVATAETDLPIDVSKSIRQEIERGKAQERAMVTEKLADLQCEADDLAEHCVAMEQELDKLTAKFSALTASHELLLDQQKEKASEIDRLLKEIDRERYTAEMARTETAQLRNKIELNTEKLVELTNTINLAQAEISAETSSRIFAEKEAAVFQAQHEKELEKTRALVLEKETLLEQLAEERQAKEAARISEVKVTQQLEYKTSCLAEKETALYLKKSFEMERNPRISAEQKTTL
jgi:colicin import membrane protein